MASEVCEPISARTRLYPESIDRAATECMNWLLWLTILRWVIRIGMIPVILRRRYPTNTSIAWMAVIFLLPILGLLAFLVLGTHVLATRSPSSPLRCR